MYFHSLFYFKKCGYELEDNDKCWNDFVIDCLHISFQDIIYFSSFKGQKKLFKNHRCLSVIYKSSSSSVFDNTIECHDDTIYDMYHYKNIPISSISIIVPSKDSIVFRDIPLKRVLPSLWCMNSCGKVCHSSESRSWLLKKCKVHSNQRLLLRIKYNMYMKWICSSLKFKSPSCSTLDLGEICNCNRKYIDPPNLSYQAEYFL